MWDGTRVLLPPSFSWGSRVSNNSRTTRRRTSASRARTSRRARDVSISLTKVAGRHTLKTGFYNPYSNKQQVQGGAAGGPALNFQQDTVGTNPCDTSFGFANAAIGCFSSYAQGSKGVEGNYIYNNVEGYVQDNWKVNRKLTLDYGVRFVHQTPQYDALGQASNFFVDKWTRSAAPTLYVAGCANGVYPCTGTNRQAMNPLTGQFLGPNTHAGDRHDRAQHRQPTNGLVQAGKGIPLTTYLQPALGVAPRFGMAYDLTGRQQHRPARRRRALLRSAVGQRRVHAGAESAGAAFGHAAIRPAADARHRRPRHRGAAVAVSVYEYDSPLPSSTQWNGGVQMALPWSSVLDVEYVGQHGYNIVEGINLNAVDFGIAVPAAEPGSDARRRRRRARRRCRPTRCARSAATARSPRTSRAAGARYHSLQLSFNRRFRNGLSFGFNDTIGLSSTRQHGGAAAAQRGRHGHATAPIRRRPTSCCRTIPIRHMMKANFVWDLPDLKSSAGALRALGLVVNDWQFPASGPRRPAARTRSAYSYQSGGGNVNLTGSPDYGARIRIVGDPGSGLHERSVPAVQHGGVPGPAGEQRRPRVRHRLPARLLPSALDLSIARNIRLRAGGTSSCAPTCSTRRSGGHHRPQHDAAYVEPERSGDERRAGVRPDHRAC